VPTSDALVADSISPDLRQLTRAVGVPSGVYRRELLYDLARRDVDDATNPVLLNDRKRAGHPA
jgi:hypothetical protein